MKHKIFAANWKMYKSPADTQKFFQNFLVIPGDSTLIFFPPALCVNHAIEATSSTHIKIGVQNIAATAEGAFTGENSASVAKEMGCQYALIGHSERRSLFQETDAMLNQKAKLAQSLDLHIVFCVGESLDQRKSNQTKSIISEQLSAGLAGLKNENLILAYEPVWAIGTGITASPQQAEQTQKEIIEWLNANGFSGVPVLYGGSVKPENAKELISQPSISGFLVGGASLNPESFAQICQA
jgi:triosephosphate isomerase